MKRKKISKIANYNPNSNCIYEILGGLMHVYDYLFFEDTIEKLLEIANFKGTEFTTYKSGLNSTQKIRYSKIDSILNIIRNAYMDRTRVKIIGFTPVNRKGEHGLFVMHEIS